MQLHTLTRKTPNKKHKIVGRGGKRGKTSGRGTKGQKARAGHRIRPDIRDVIKKLPKLRGYRNTSIELKCKLVNLATLERLFTDGETVTRAELRTRGAIGGRKGVLPGVKILGDGEITKKLTIQGCMISASAKEKVEKAGGSIAQS